ncbi:MAG: GPR endopeptidase [Acutalibacteraceae bacterium]
MLLRTDLAIEAHKISGEITDGIDVYERQCGTLKINRMNIRTEKASIKLHKPLGNYITIDGLPLTDNFREVPQQVQAVSEEIRSLLPKSGTVLVIGLGNVNITPDALGPKTASAVLATRHITGELARSTGLDRLRSVAVLSPGVLGQTGIETGELIISLIKRLEPSAVIAVDALASRSLARLGCTVQISDSGISPGTGVGNNRLSLNKKTMGVPVVGIGIPTVVDATTLASELFEGSEINFSQLKSAVSPRGEKMIVTPSEIDLLIERASKLIGMAINCALQSQFSFEELISLVS